MILCVPVLSILAYPLSFLILFESILFCWGGLSKGLSILIDFFFLQRTVFWFCFWGFWWCGDLGYFWAHKLNSGESHCIINCIKLFFNYMYGRHKDPLKMNISDMSQRKGKAQYIFLSLQPY